MVDFWNKLSGFRTQIGILAAAALGILVSWSDTDTLTWETGWVTTALWVIGGWTGVAVRAAAKKMERPDVSPN